MHIQVINPNTSAQMTRTIGDTARAAAWPGVLVTATHAGEGPACIESHYDEALAVPGLLTEIITGEQSGVDGYVIACFGDPGLQAARELAAGPVVGIAEAAMKTATYLGRRFSVVTSLERTIGRAQDLALGYGVDGACGGVHACGVGPLELDGDPDAYTEVLSSCRLAMRVDHSDVIVLGCAGMAGWAQQLSKDLKAPVVDGVVAAVGVLQGLLYSGLTTSTVCEFDAPPAKPYSGGMARFGAAGAESRRSAPFAAFKPGATGLGGVERS